jgi:hypothetical protein
MFGCESCCYLSDEGKCLVRKVMSDRRREQGCDSFIDKEFKPQFSDCCGVYNMPNRKSSEDTDAELCQEP